LASQCCAWVRRASNLDEFWKRELFSKAYGTVFNLRKSTLSSKNNPILYYIADSFEKFTFKFTARNENFAMAYIYENPSLPLDVNHNNYLKREFFSEQELLLHEKEIKKLTMDQILNPDFSLKSKHEFENISSITLTDLKYTRLQGLARTAVMKYRRVDNNLKKRDSIQNFCMRIKRGSKKFRQIISGIEPEVISTNISKYSDIIDHVINLEFSLRLNVQWTFNFLDNSTRTFIFKLHNNLLGTNTRVAHFVRRQSRSCTFCTLGRENEDNDETILHLFFNCRYVEEILTQFYRWIFHTANNDVISACDFLRGFNVECVKKKFVLDLVGIVTKKYIWDCKLRYNISTLENLKKEFLDSFQNFFKISNKFRDAIITSEIFRGHDTIRF
jgi:hypothetical protein